jgi:membrane protein DedA with SNARE-associated domain
MEQLAVFLEQYGYMLLFGVGFLEYAGAPIASVPVLVIAGALAAMGHSSLPGVVIAAALGGLTADLAWYSIARHTGQSLVEAACGLATNPKSCVVSVERRLRSVGPAYLVLAKFIPGAGNLAAAASGYAGIGLRRFFVFDGIGLLLWASVYVGAGWVFSAQVERVIEWASGFAMLVLFSAIGLIAGAGVWRFMKVRMHRPMHEAVRAAEASPDYGDSRATVQPSSSSV